MNQSAAVIVAMDLLRQAIARRWILALFGTMTLALMLLGLSLRLDVVDGALAGTHLFGRLMGSGVQSVGLALSPVFAAASHLIVYGFSAFLILATADFAPSLLAPGRIEHLLALPVRRWELFLGTYLGVCVLTAATALYGAGGLALVLGFKTGVWTLWPLVAGLMGSLGFFGIYAVMLTTAVVVRSAAVSAALGALFYIGSIVAGYRESVATATNEGPVRQAFLFGTALVPRLSRLSEGAAALGSGGPVSFAGMVSVVVGFLLFSAGVLAVGVWLFQRHDY